ncbi:MAG: hypothetical protein ACTSRE_11680 [Promethearchaeota archaeon]
MQTVSEIWAWILGLGVVWIIVSVLIIFVLQTIFLTIGLKAVKGSNRKFGSVFGTALINWICTFVPIIGCILQWIVINTRHKTGFGNAIVAWLIAIVVPVAIVIGLVLILIFAGILPALT